jgi:glyoxylase-like metal-dependent hydrolase (beta-lactamase superfamily II)
MIPNRFFIGLRRTALSLLATAMIGVVPAHAQVSDPPAARADIPMVQAPGFYRQRVGSSLITAVYDGYVYLNTTALSGLNAAEIQTLVARMFQSRTGVVQTAVNAFLVETGSQLVLVNSGSSDCFGPTMGRMIDNVRAAGYDPKDVDAVLLTHMHPDHACGVTSPDGKPNFPNATIWADKDDAAFWLNTGSGTQLPEGQRAFIDMARKAIAPYAEAGRFKTFDDGAEVIPGFRSIATAGHTPGHTSYLMGRGDDAVLLWGDIVHFHAVQLQHPEVTIEVDRNPAAAITTRRRILAQVADRRWWIATAHLPFPGIGHIRKDAAGYSYVPAEYAPLRGIADSVR